MSTSKNTTTTPRLETHRFFKLEPLDSRNYQTWSIRMMIALAESKCKSLVLGQEKRPERGDEGREGKRTSSTSEKPEEVPLPLGSEELLAKQDDWDARNEFALHRIQMAVSDRELMKISSASLGNAQSRSSSRRNSREDDGSTKAPRPPHG